MGLFRKRSGLFGEFSRGDTERKDVREVSESAGATPIDRCVRGIEVTLAGVLSSVTMRPHAGVPAVEADLYDGTGHVLLVWLGRRHIGGVEAGRAIVVTGRTTCTDDRTIVYNPRYQLRPRGVS